MFPVRIAVCSRITHTLWIEPKMVERQPPYTKPFKMRCCCGVTLTEVNTIAINVKHRKGFAVHFISRAERKRLRLPLVDTINVCIFQPKNNHGFALQPWEALWIGHNCLRAVATLHIDSRSRRHIK